MSAISPSQFAQDNFMTPPATVTVPPQGIIHMSGPEDRWDYLAALYYGDDTLFGTIIMANAQLPISPTIPQGVPVFIPMITPAPASTGSPLPWLA